jgi:hypothetical protein
MNNDIPAKNDKMKQLLNGTGKRGKEKCPRNGALY